ncbi:MAG: class I SAM-dependent methyltransferase [Nitrospirae bacterium]|uniref:class I SAM-dependent methyltransferase n=1 Tax=Candidatus Magnetobacterium casense TaxID=1455061 RepID=UPI00058FE5A1|nr:class I SAM-dependent methyltransferase [Candidatus Magnetobacterium casensis]MBF0339079.1 class I SAM-dependent methyltransferase [Nitrospirota bacterium]
MSGFGSYYDGWFYSKIIDPATEDIRQAIGGFIEDDSSVIDIGCGTGKLAFELSRRCRRVVGADLSPRMINFANRQKLRHKASNVDFIHADAADALNIEQQFDYAVMSFVLHSVTLKEEIAIINNLRDITRYFIFADYAVPQPKSAIGLIAFLAEFAAGGKHFKSYRAFMRNNGLDNLTEQCGLSVKGQITDKTAAYKVLLAESRQA